MSNLVKNAIEAALASDWQKAITLNQNILAENKEDVNSLNRLAHAYMQISKTDEARKLYKKILALDKYNYIAIKNLEKLTALPKTPKKYSVGKSSPVQVSPSLFIEEPGKTKTLNLINAAPISILSHLSCATEVFLFSKKHSIEIRTQNKIYLGSLPDDFAFKLLRFLKAGYEYKIYIKSVTKNNISVFIRETKRAKRFKSQPSFVSPIASKNIFSDHKRKDNDDDGVEEKTLQEDLEE